MSCPSGLRPPNVQTGTKPKSRLAKLAGSKFSPKKLQAASSSIEASSPISQPTGQNPESSPGRSPRRHQHSEEIQKQIRQSPASSPKRLASSPRRQGTPNPIEEDYEMGLVYEQSPMTLADEPVMSFLEFESLYNLEKELGQARRDTIAELDDKCIFGGWFGTRRGVYTELPEPSRNFECMSRGCTTAQSTQVPTEGFSFAPGWAINAQHFYQWHQRGKSIQQVRLDSPDILLFEFNDRFCQIIIFKFTFGIDELI